MTKSPDKGAGIQARALDFLETQNGQRSVVILFSLVATAAVVLAPGGLLAYIFGVPLIFFVPGFAVVRLFFQKGTSAETRFVLSLGLSILVAILLGLILVLTPVGLTPDSTRASLIFFTLGAVALETFWLSRSGAEEKKPQETTEPPEKMDKVVAAMLATALVVSGISLGLIVTAERPSRTYFALTDANGMVVANTTYYVGQNITLVAHMFNGEDGERTFVLSAYGLESYDFSTQTFNKTLARNEVWNQTVEFNLNLSGYFRLDFDLYIESDDLPPYLYGTLHLWIRVL